MGLAREHLSPAQLEDAVPVRSYKLTTHHHRAGTT